MKTNHKSVVWIVSFILLASTGSTFGQRQVTISEAIDSSLAINPRLSMTKAQVSASRSAVSQATGSLLPQLYATAGYTLYEEPNIVTPIHQQGVFPPLDEELYEANLQLSIPIFDGGRRLTQRKIATTNVDESKATNDLVRNEILKQVAEIFLYARQMDDQSLLINKRLATLYQQMQDLQVLATEGRVSKGDLALVSSLIASTRSDSSAVAHSRFQLSIRLSSLLGTENLVVPAASSNTLDMGLLRRLYPREESGNTHIVGPTVRLSEARAKKANASKSLASRVFWPEISGYGAYSYRTGSDWEVDSHLKCNSLSPNNSAGVRKSRHFLGVLL
ncbi:MAG: TolC family protein [Candidatus Zixiibacteriota bacterium]